MKAEDFLGMGKRPAQNKAEDAGFIFRLIRVDGEAFYSYPEDVRTDRLCVEIDNNKVTKVTIQ